VARRLSVLLWPGCLPHASEGKGESQPAASSPGCGGGGGGDAASPATPNGSVMARSNGHANGRAPSGHADLLSGEDSAPDEGPAVTSPATATTPGAPSCRRAIFQEFMRSLLTHSVCVSL